jgi:hypothetical protein
MHYKNGTKANEGDFIICQPNTGRGAGYITAGVLHSIVPSSETCNGLIAFPIPGGVKQELINIKDCLHANDAYEAVEVKAPKTLQEGHFVCWICKQEREASPAYSTVSVTGNRFDYCAHCWSSEPKDRAGIV